MKCHEEELKKAKCRASELYENVNEKANRQTFIIPCNRGSELTGEELSQLFESDGRGRADHALEKETKEKHLKRQNELAEEEKRIQRKVWLEKNSESELL
ncbi:MAG: hypothetical protein ACLUFY_06710 [[Ruminococcus] torques]